MVYSQIKPYYVTMTRMLLYLWDFPYQITEGTKYKNADNSNGTTATNDEVKTLGAATEK